MHELEMLQKDVVFTPFKILKREAPVHLKSLKSSKISLRIAILGLKYLFLEEIKHSTRGVTSAKNAIISLKTPEISLF